MSSSSPTREAFDLPGHIFHPEDCIVPILGIDEDGSEAMLGTGFLVAHPNVLVTCWHVVRDWKKRIVIAPRPKAPERFELGQRWSDDALDLCCFRVPAYPRGVRLDVTTRQIHLNQMIVCYEYGATIVKRGQKLTLEPAARIGNITRIRDLRHMYRDAGLEMLELSFPALLGASGAPVMINEPPFSVVGVIKANVSAELLPAQLETIYDENGRVEEQTRFYLPQALAIHLKRLRSFLDDVMIEEAR